MSRRPSLDNLSIPKHQAADTPPHTDPAAPRPRNDPPAPSARARVRTLSLRLTEDDYQRLRRFAFETERSHQDVLEAALREYLGRQGP